MNTLELLDKKEQLKQRAEEIVSKAEKETRRLNKKDCKRDKTNKHK